MILNRKDKDTDKIDNNKSLDDQREYLIKRFEEDITRLEMKTGKISNIQIGQLRIDLNQMIGVN